MKSLANLGAELILIDDPVVQVYERFVNILMKPLIVDLVTVENVINGGRNLHLATTDIPDFRMRVTHSCGKLCWPNDCAFNAIRAHSLGVESKFG